MKRAVEKALHMHREQPAQWRALRLAGMRQDLSWQASTRHSTTFYAEAIVCREHQPAAAMA